MSDKSKEQQSVKHLNDVKSNTSDEKLKEKIEKKLTYFNKPLSK